MDVLTDVLETVRLKAACYGRVELTAPWGFQIGASSEAKFHVVLRGNCWLEVEGLEDPVPLTSGDLVAMPHGAPHAVRDSLDSVARPIHEILPHQKKPVCEQRFRGADDAIRFGGGSQGTTLVCGAFSFDDQRNNPLLSVLPPLIVVRGEEGRAVRWLEPTLQFIACEAASGRPGAQTVISRLADVLFIQLVRAHLASLSGQNSGWLGALAEPQIGNALSMIHQNPEESWTVAELASRVGMSRSAFASRFARLVGEPPLQYITRWRMQKAAGFLRDGHATLAEIAERVGYDSEAAFSKAFKRWVGSAPGAYRRAAKATGLSQAAA